MPSKKSKLALATNPESSIYSDMINIFQSVKKNSTCHEKCIKMMQNIYNKVDCQTFTKHFVSCLLIPLRIGQKNSAVEFTLDFAAKFSSTFSQDISDDSNDTEMHPFLLNVFNFAIKHCECNSPGVRYRVCQFICKILVFMGENAELDDQLCDDILKAMLIRLQDIKYKVRTQAVIALHRLQNPTEPNDQVTKAYLFHLSNDPKAPVRRAVINNLARSAKAFCAVNKRIQDVDEKVRRDAYNFMSIFSSKMFQIKQRIQLLENGLNDRSECVQTCVSEILLPKWFVHFDRSYFDFIKGITLDATVEDLQRSIKVAKQMLGVFFQKEPAIDLISALPLSEAKVVSPPERLNHEVVTFWRCLAHFFYNQKNQEQDYLNEIIPELTEFCSYIRSYVQSVRNKTRDRWQELVHQSILHQLFEMCNFFDFSDEVGRSNLIFLINEFLLKEKLDTEVINTMIDILEKLKPDSKRRLLELVELISDITDPLQDLEEENQEAADLTEDIQRRKNVKISDLRFKLNILINDEETAVAEKDYLEAAKLKEQIIDTRKKLNELTAAPVPVQKSPAEKKLDDEANIVKALDIIIAMLKSKSIKTFPTELRILQQNFILDLCSQNSHSSKIEAKALTSLAICASLDENLAINIVAPKLFFRLMNYQYNKSVSVKVVLVCLSAIFDLIMAYELSKFPEAEENTKNNRTKRTLYDNTQEDDDDELDLEAIITNTNLPSNNLRTSFNEIISCILSFIDDDNADVRTLAADGLCRLLVTGQVKSTEVLTRLLVLWFNPATANDRKMRQIIGVSINHFAQHVSGGQEEIVKAFLPTINTILQAPTNSPLTQVDVDGCINFLLFHTQPGVSLIDTLVNAHNQLAIIICEEILKCKRRDCGYYIKCLPCLKISDDDELLKKDLHNLCIKILADLTSKAYAKYINKFVNVIMNQTVSESTNQEQETEMDNDETGETTVPSTPRTTALLRKPVVQLTRMDISMRTPTNNKRSTRLRRSLVGNEDNVNIVESSPSSSKSSRPGCSEDVVISETESDDETSSDESDTSQLSPMRRRSQRTSHWPQTMDL